MQKRIICICAMLLLLGFALTGCVPGGGAYYYENPAGFFWGLWHGVIVIFTLIGSIFSDTVTIYEAYNTGFWYNLGFLMGAASPFGGKLIFFSGD
ncbi:MAG: hypothetical protein FWC78_00505 [Defluviitaleaceae bacterium]|nr:hypothetical protein [Defluviitaleaceae bacterium]